MKRKSKKRRTRVRGKENKRNTKRNTKRNKRGGMRFMRRQSDDPNELTRRENMRQELDERMRVIERDEENIRVRARAALDINDYDELMKIALRGTQKKIEKIRLQIYIATPKFKIETNKNMSSYMSNNPPYLSLRWYFSDNNAVVQ